MKNLFVFISFLLCLSICLASCQGTSPQNTETDPNSSQNSNISTRPDIPNGEIPEDISKEDLGDMDFSLTDRDKEANFDDKVTNLGKIDSDYEITSQGTYIFTGNIIDNTIIVKANENDKVQIVLDNVTIKNSKGPAIYIASADKVFITLKDGTENNITDGSNYNTSDDNGEIDGAIFSRADLTINGNGQLTVNGNYKHGIVSKDDLVIANAKLNVTSKKVALNGKDCVKISAADINLNAGSDGIRSDNDEDKNRGFVYIESGVVDITAENDGIQAETVVKIDNGEIKIVAGGGSLANVSNSSESFKGIKAASDIIIHNGNFYINSLDDAIHSNNTICIEDGIFEIATKDDGIHADIDLAIASGEIAIKKSYEGLESSRVFITGGNIEITASDDGINAAGGNDSSSNNNPFGGAPPLFGGFGGDMFGNGVGEIVISGGYILVDASGDGIDSNGTISLAGGVVLVSGPTNNGNGALDYDGSATVTGGTFIALGSSGMAQNFSEAENQGSILTTFNTLSGGTNIAICDVNGKTIISFTPKKAYTSMTVTTPTLQLNQKYSIYSGATVSGADKNGYAVGTTISGGTLIGEITLDSLIYGGVGGGMPGGKPGGGKPPRR